MKPGLFDNFKNENLPLPMLVFKRIGQASFIVLIATIAISQLNQGRVGGNLFLDATAWAGGVSFFIGIACFAVVGLFSLGKNRKNTTAHAIGKSFLKVLLFIYLPAAIITAILILTITLPRVQ